MARGADKARVQRNAAVLRALRIGAAAVLSLYALLQLVVLRRWDRPGVWVALLTHGAGYLLVLRKFRLMAEPRYDSTGRLTSGGADLTVGVLSYVYDLCYVTAATLLLSVWTPRAFWGDLVIPGYALVRFWKGCIRPLLDAGPEEGEGSTAQAPARRARVTVRGADGRSRTLRMKN